MAQILPQSTCHRLHQLKYWLHHLMQPLQPVPALRLELPRSISDPYAIIAMGVAMGMCAAMGMSNFLHLISAVCFGIIMQPWIEPALERLRTVLWSNEMRFRTFRRFMSSWFVGRLMIRYCERIYFGAVDFDNLLHWPIGTSISMILFIVLCTLPIIISVSVYRLLLRVA